MTDYDFKFDVPEEEYDGQKFSEELSEKYKFFKNIMMVVLIVTPISYAFAFWTTAAPIGDKMNLTFIAVISVMIVYNMIIHRVHTGLDGVSVVLSETYVGETQTDVADLLSNTKGWETKKGEQLKIVEKHLVALPAKVKDITEYRARYAISIKNTLASLNDIMKQEAGIMIDFINKLHYCIYSEKIRTFSKISRNC